MVSFLIVGPAGIVTDELNHGKEHIVKKFIVFLALAVAVLPMILIGTAGLSSAERQEKRQPLMGGLGMGRGSIAGFDETGALLRPHRYREWIFIGGPVTPNDMNGGKAAFPEFHAVYIDRPSFAEYRRTGKFPDGTLLVKELISVGSKKAASGNGYFPGDYIGLAAAVKDAKRFPNEPGNWAYFSFEAGKDRAVALATASCNACHKANAAEDWVFTQYYPVLTSEKEDGAKRPKR